MSIFMPPPYESDHTKFIRELTQKNPQIEDGQLKGRSILWDKSIDREAQSRYRASQVPTSGYAYQNKVGPTPSAGPSAKGT
jgi:hypothetical protein